MPLVRELLQISSERLRLVNHERCQLESRLLMAKVLRCAPDDLWAMDDRVLSESESRALESLVHRRQNFEPVAYLTGTKEFFGLNFKVDSRALIPRPETEWLVEGVLDWIREHQLSEGRILDLGTGSGCIILSLAHSLGVQFSYEAWDISEEALALAKENAKALGLDKKIQFERRSLFELTPGPYDIIVSNPPYIATEELNSLQPDIQGYEPPLALDGGAKGTHFLTHLVKRAPDGMRRPGLLALETGGEKQQDELEVLFRGRSCRKGIHLLLETQHGS